MPTSKRSGLLRQLRQFLQQLPLLRRFLQLQLAQTSSLWHLARQHLALLQLPVLLSWRSMQLARRTRLPLPLSTTPLLRRCLMRCRQRTTATMTTLLPLLLPVMLTLKLMMTATRSTISRLRLQSLLRSQNPQAQPQQRLNLLVPLVLGMMRMNFPTSAQPQTSAAQVSPLLQLRLLLQQRQRRLRRLLLKRQSPLASLQLRTRSLPPSAQHSR